MTASARLLTSVEPEQHERFSELAAAQGVSSSRLLARLVHRALIENPEAKVRRLLEEAAAGKAPAEKLHRAPTRSLESCAPVES
jgi:hypothetical protein